MSISRMKSYIAGDETDLLPITGGVDSFEFARKHLGYDPLVDQTRTYTDLISMLDYDYVTGYANPYAEYNIPMVRYFGEVEVDPSVELRFETLDESRRWRSVHHKLSPRVRAQPLGFTPTLFTQDYGISDVEEALSCDPCAADPRAEEQVFGFLRDYYAGGQALVSDALFVPWYYNLLFMWPVEIFGWELFMTAVMADEEQFDSMLARFFEVSKRDLTAMAEASGSDLMIVHDDLCSAIGPIFRPEWYMEHIFPRYNELLAVLKQKNKKVILCIDGRIDLLLDDILGCGFDGLQVQPETDLQLVCRKLSEYGKPFLVTGLPQSEMERSTADELPRKLDGFVEAIPKDVRLCLRVGGLYNNVPVENIEALFKHLGRMI